MLVRPIVAGQTTLKNEYHKNTEEQILSRVYGVAQDLWYCDSTGRKFTPKYVGLTSTLHQSKRSKYRVRLFHMVEHCLSYEQVFWTRNGHFFSWEYTLITGWDHWRSYSSKAEKFVRYTCNNIDILDASLDGKNTFHATRMATWQRSQASGESCKHLEPSRDAH